MPSDPAALLALGAKKNGLQNLQTPWHLKATYQLLDEKGSVRETGTMEEFYESDKSYKLSYSSPSFTQTDYSSESGLFRTGDPGWPQGALAVVHQSFFPPFPTDDLINKGPLDAREKSLGGAALSCVKLGSELGEGYFGLYCFDPSAPRLRIADIHHAEMQTVYNDLVSVGGTYMARDTTFSVLGKAQLRIHVEQIELLPHVDENTFVTPQNALNIPRRASVETSLVIPQVIRKVAPKYGDPRVYGVILLNVVVGKDGKVLDVRLKSGPPELAKVAMDAVWQWQYEPCMLNGEPIEVQTGAGLVFGMVAKNH